MTRHQNNITILLHCHIFKNGGSTIDNILTKNFRERALFRENSNGQNFLLSNSILEFIDNSGQEKIASISSHSMGLPAPKHDLIHFIPLIIIREPLDRLGSMYSFYQRHNNHISHECLLAKRNTLKSFVETLFQCGLDSSFSNLQCQFLLANYFPPKHPSDKTWPTIIENLRSIHCVGLLEMFDESMVLWEEYLRKFIATIDLSYEKKNVSENRLSALNSRLEIIHEQLGDNLVTEFKKRNVYDYQLYEIIKDRLLGAINNNKTFTELLSNFRRKMYVDGKRVADSTSQEPTSLTRLEQDTPLQPISTVSLDAKQNLLDSQKPLKTNAVATSNDIISCGLFAPGSGEEIHIVHQGQRVEVTIAIKTKDTIDKPIVGITITDSNQQIVVAMNSLYSSEKIYPLKEHSEITYHFLFTMPPLNSGSYTVTPAFASGTQEEHTILAEINDAILFFVPRMIKQRMPGFLHINDYRVTTDN